MDVDALAIRLKALEDKLARYEPMLEEVLPDYLQRAKQESAEAAEMKKGLIDALEQAGVTRTYGNARCAPITGNESVEELQSMLEAARLGQQEAADAKALQDAADEALRVENERVAQEAAAKVEADRVEAERVASEAKAAADAQAEETRLAEEAAAKERAAQAASDPDKNPGVVLQPGAGTTEPSATTEVTTTGSTVLDETAAGPEQGEQPAAAQDPAAVPVVEEHPDAAAARDKGKKAFIKYAMKEAGMSEDEANWAWDHPPTRTED